MSTNTKLAEALRLAREWFRHEEAGEGPQVHDVIEAADEALAAHDAEQALPRKERPDFMAGYVAGLADGRRCAERDSAEQAAKAVPAGFVLVPVEFIEAGQRIAQDYVRTNPKWPMWDNGEAEPKVQDPCGAHAWLERAAMLAAAPTPPAPEAQRREPLTDEQIRREKPVCADWMSFRAGVRCAERIHEVSK